MEIYNLRRISLDYTGAWVTLWVTENGEGEGEQQIVFKAENIPSIHFSFPKSLISHIVNYHYIDFVIYKISCKSKCLF